jgi:hypothetical protein
VCVHLLKGDFHPETNGMMNQWLEAIDSQHAFPNSSVAHEPLEFGGMEMKY